MKEQSRLVIFSAPSGSGKSTIIRHLIERGLPLVFSVSATSRKQRGQEKHGVDYYFLSPEDFQKQIQEGHFLEYEEVYPSCFYGTLKSEIDRLLAQGAHPVLDVDVQGGLRIKEIYGSRALAIFVQPPSIDILRERLIHRGTEAPETIETRLAKARWELEHAKDFDLVIINDQLERACQEAEEHIRAFLNI